MTAEFTKEGLKAQPMMKADIAISHLKPVLGLPTYDGSNVNRMALVNYARQFPKGAIIEPNSSCLGHAFNLCFQFARKEYFAGKATHFIMLHADVIPLNHNWGELLLAESEAYQASVLSAIIPIKTTEGLTSTAIERKATQDGNGWHPVRFTMKEIMTMPETFSHPRLMLNTGLMVIDLRQAWCHKLVFDIQCGVNTENFDPYFLPEDWKMSRFAQENNASLYATRKVQVLHRGSAPYGNDKAWGSKATEGALEIYQHEA